MVDSADMPVVVYRAVPGAHAAKVMDLLRAHGIAPTVLHTRGIEPSPRRGSVPIAVPPPDVARAREVLYAWEHAHDATAAPHARSAGRKLLLVAAFVLGVPLLVWWLFPDLDDQLYVLSFVIPLFGAILYGNGKRLLQEWRRPPRGHCQQCGYNLRGNVSGRCPECGTEVPKRRRH